MSNEMCHHGDREQHALLRQASHAEKIGRRNIRHGRLVEAHGGISIDQYDKIEECCNDPAKWADLKQRVADEGVKRGVFSATDAANVGAFDWQQIFDCAMKILPLVIAVLPFVMAPNPLGAATDAPEGQ